jgi:predicted dehydrogenase
MYPALGLTPRLVALCGRDPARLKRRAGELGFAETYTDWRAVADDPRIELFDNCGPDPVHAEPSIAALKAGKHVICEKPLAVSVAAAREMRDAARQAVGRSMCMFNYRFFPAVCYARQMIRDGRLGRIYHMRVRYLQMAGRDPSLPPDQVWYSAWPHSGVLQGIGSHAIDQCRMLVGEIAAVSATIRTFDPARAIPTEAGDGAVADEATAAALEFENGAIGTLEASAVATGHKNRLEWEINGSAGSLRWNLEHPSSLWVSLDRPGEDLLGGFAEVSVTESGHPLMREWWPPGHSLGWEHGHVIGMACFLKAVLGGEPLPEFAPTFEDGYRVAVLIAAMRRSSQTGQRVRPAFD